MRDGVRHHLEPDHAVALEVLCLVILDHERQMVEKVASAFMLEPHREAVGGLTAPIGAASQAFLRQQMRQTDKTFAQYMLSTGFPLGGSNSGGRDYGVG